LREKFDQALSEMAWGDKVDEAARQMMLTHVGRALEINKSMNLTRITEDEEMIQRHLIDSLWIIPAMEAWGAGRPDIFLDMGAGGGWPFVPLKSIWRKSEGWAAEKSQKKAKFLKGLCEEVLPRAQVWDKQARELKRKSFDLITARAVGKLDYIFKECFHAIKPDGLLVCYKGPSVEEELDDWQVLCQKNNFEQLPAVAFTLKDGSERYLVGARAC
jgi:16S rRNA (guanine527-N7)-methyltransferase